MPAAEVLEDTMLAAFWCSGCSSCHHRIGDRIGRSRLCPAGKPLRGEDLDVTTEKALSNDATHDTWTHTAGPPPMSTYAERSRYPGSDPFPFHSVSSPHRGDQSGTGSHLRIQTPQCPGQLVPHARYRSRLSGFVWAFAWELSQAGRGGREPQQHHPGGPRRQHDLLGDSLRHL